MNDYEAKQEAKRERYEELAEKHRQRATQRRAAADQISNMIPMGQPILVGHHSEGRHRRDLKRMDTNLRKSWEHQDTAKYYDNKADGVGKGGVSSDDPDAVVKLKEKLAQLEELHEVEKKANRAIRLKDTAKGDAALLELGYSQAIIDELRTPDYMGRVGFPSYSGSNRSSNMRRIRQRIEELKAAPTETVEHQHGDIRIVENAEENRIQIIFPGKPSEEVRQTLKSHGFRWSRSNMAWQRHLNNAGRYAAENVIKRIS